MSATHTPGPWTITAYYDKHFEIQHERPIGGPLHVAFLRVTGLSTDEANARLIAKAPELLDELRATSTNYQNIIELLTPSADEDRWTADLLAQIEGYDEAARALLAEIDGKDGTP